MRGTGIVKTGLLIAISSLPDMASAQIDRASRSDISDFRASRAIQQAQSKPDLFESQSIDLEGAAEPPKPSVDMTLSAGGNYATNPGQVKSGQMDGIYATPSADFAFTDPRGDWQLGARLTVDGDYFPRHTADFDESRVDGRITLKHPTNIGALSLTFRAKASFDAGFGTNNYVQERYILGFAPHFGEVISMATELEYRASETENQRRAILRVSAGKTIALSSTVGVALTEKLEYSRFRAGTNDGRKDLLSSSAIELDPPLMLTTRLKLGVAALLFHNFSNRTEKRFTDFEIGPALAYSF